MSVELERDLRTYTAYLDEILPTITADEIRAETYPLAPGGPPKWQRRKVLVAAVAAFATLVLIGGVALLGNRTGSDNVFIDQPPPITEPTILTSTVPPTTSPPSPTTIAAALDGKITTPVYTDVPSFTGTVQYYEHDSASGRGWQATVSVSFAGPMRYEVEVMAEEGGLFLGGTGKVFLGDGTVTWLNEFEGEPLAFVSGFDHFRHFYYDSDWPSPAWDEICAEGTTVLGSEVMLGRTVSHVACPATGDYELWVDEESGLVLKMAGPLEIGDYSARTAQDGGFTFTDLTFEPVTIPDPPEVLPTGQTGEFPPFHLIRTEPQSGMVREYWYQNADRLRETFIEGEWIGTFTLISDGRLAGCNSDPFEQSCYNVPIEDASDIYPMWMPYWQVPVSLVEERCTELSQDSVAGRETRHFMCDGVSFQPAANDNWTAISNPFELNEFWYDTATNLMMKEVSGEQDMIVKEVTLLEVNPAFPVGIFVYEELVPPSDPNNG